MREMCRQLGNRRFVCIVALRRGGGEQIVLSNVLSELFCFYCCYTVMSPYTPIYYGLYTAGPVPADVVLFVFPGLPKRQFCDPRVVVVVMPASLTHSCSCCSSLCQSGSHCDTDVGSSPSTIHTSMILISHNLLRRSSTSHDTTHTSHATVPSS